MMCVKLTAKFTHSTLIRHDTRTKSELLGARAGRRFAATHKFQDGLPRRRTSNLAHKEGVMRLLIMRPTEEAEEDDGKWQRERQAVSVIRDTFVRGN